MVCDSRLAGTCISCMKKNRIVHSFTKFQDKQNLIPAVRNHEQLKFQWLCSVTRNL